MENSVLIPSPKEESEQLRWQKAHETGQVHSAAPSRALETLPSIIGNRSSQRVLAPLVIQPKLTIGAPDDEYEKEADEVAEQVMSFRAPQGARGVGSDDDEGPHSRLARKPADQKLARQAMLGRIPIRTLQKTLGNRALARLLQERLAAHGASELRRKCACGGEAEGECAGCRASQLALQRSSASEDASIEAPPVVESVLATPGQPLAESARRALEPGFGHDFSEVRVHDSSEAAESRLSGKCSRRHSGQSHCFRSGPICAGDQ